MEMKRGNYAKALQDLLWLRKRNTGSEPKTLLTQIAQCYDAVGNKQLEYQDPYTIYIIHEVTIVEMATSKWHIYTWTAHVCGQTR